jgi:Activator of Hsp90 ATPase homolog 1-like protein
MSSTRISCYSCFVKLVANEEVIEMDEFETDDPAFRGEMPITISLIDLRGGTDLVAVHDGLPRGVSPLITRSAGGWSWQTSQCSWRHTPMAKFGRVIRILNNGTKRRRAYAIVQGRRLHAKNR